MFEFVLAGFMVAFVVVLVLAEALGRWLAMRAKTIGADPEAERDRTGHVLTSTFGLLALLIGFSFGIVLDRYDTRRADVVAEANAISTAHYHAGFAGAAGAGIQDSLERYARHRVTYGETGQFEREALEVRAARLRAEIAGAANKLAPQANSPLGSLVLSDITAVLDLGVEREANIRAKLPWMVFTVLLGLSLIGACMMGFAYPMGGLPRYGASLLLFFLLALTIGMIVDLDRPAGGGTRVDQTPMRQLVAELAATPAPSPPAPDQPAQNERTAS